ncbi:MAG TPA: ATP-binding protein [Acetobacteraceae bacterium]|nr:ATP-binding protein [Acetobacteraceae bacterium]
MSASSRSFQPRTIDIVEASRIVRLEESHYLDVKDIDIRPAKLTESASAFANTGGGELFVGISERTEHGRIERAWRGFPTMEAANGHVQAIEAMSPLGNHYEAEFIACAPLAGYVLHITVFKTKDILFASGGAAYVRRNASKAPVVGEVALQRLRLDKGIVTFEDETANAALDEITNSVVSNSFILNVVPSSEPLPWMTKQKLIVGDKPTVAGILLFSDEPQTALPKRSAIKIYRYKTKDDEGERDTLAFDPITVEGCLYDQITEAVSKTKGLIEGIKRLGEKGLESVIYPDETLHEVVTNAVLHRDYSIASDVHIRIYDNRIEVESPGRLPGHVTTQNFLDEQSARNPKIVRLINKFPNPPNKDVGEGLNTAFAAMKRMRLKDPELLEKQHSVIVNIRHVSLASPHEAVMNYLQSHPEITNSIARDLCGIRSENVMKDVFLALKSRGEIEPVPGKKGSASAWRLVGKVASGAPPASSSAHR